MLFLVTSRGACSDIVLFSPELLRVRSTCEDSVAIDTEMKALRQQKQELELRLARLQQETKTDSNNDDSVASLQALVARLRSNVTASEQREVECVRNLDELRIEHAQTKHVLADSQQARVALEQSMAGAHDEIVRLRKQLALRDRERESFAEFVQLKRDAQALQRENELLRSKIKTRPKKNKQANDVTQLSHPTHQPTQSLPSLNYHPASTSVKRLDSGSLRPKQLPSYA